MFRLSAVKPLLRTAQLSTRALSSSRPVLSAAPKKEKVDTPLTHPSLLKDPPISNPSSETDPWSLVPPPPPSHPEGIEFMTVAELIASPHPEGRDNEPTETLRKRLVYESRKRGILETDLILATFAKERLGTMVDRELREYDRVRSLHSLLARCASWSRVQHYSCRSYS